ncbi:MAG TPA: hypothetical protein H9913_13090 [Candidatus Blautia stercoripullorum]|uniref:Uncharacterized protein n=1 Tax=Candidatus Blautia stercoripullorum TaxID=2838502 RepID=A0A9D2RBX9_9FIRM|nr:hypothetical protein [Candidatus Blautia stercoripullorum]
MERKWETPRVLVQEFEPNEYVAVCWGVACDVSWANDYEQRYGFWDGGNVSHASDHCGNSSNQVIYDWNNDGVGERMVETGTDGLGTLNCRIYEDCTETGKFINPISASQVQVGDLIYWTTSAGNRTWHHRGTVTATAEGHPNRS